MTATSRSRARPLLYGRRKGKKLSARQEGLRETLLPEIKFTPQAQADPSSYFGVPVREVWLEVGFGAGEHLIWQAERHSGIGILGAEPYLSGVAKLLSRLSVGSDSQNASGDDERREREEALPRIRLYEGDARDIIAALPDASIGRAFILFPDPWPKTRHHKRRFVQMEMLDQLARVMRAGAELRFASDDAGYLAWTLERLSAHPDFRWTAARPSDFRERPSDWPQTRYEAKALHGPPVFLRFVRK